MPATASTAAGPIFHSTRWRDRHECDIRTSSGSIVPGTRFARPCAARGHPAVRGAGRRPATRSLHVLRRLEQGHQRRQRATAGPVRRDGRHRRDRQGQSPGVLLQSRAQDAPGPHLADHRSNRAPEVVLDHDDDGAHARCDREQPVRPRAEAEHQAAEVAGRAHGQGRPAVPRAARPLQVLRRAAAPA